MREVIWLDPGDVVNEVDYISSPCQMIHGGSLMTASEKVPQISPI